MSRFGIFVVGLIAISLMQGAEARAQAHVSAYAQATGASLQSPNVSHVYGGTFGFLYELDRGPVLVGVDARGAIMSRGSSVGPFNDQAFNMGQAGIRVAAPGLLHGINALAPYAEGALGLGYWRGGITPARQDSNQFLYQAIGGLDYRVWQKLGWRVAEITYGRMGAIPGHVNPITVSSGIVYHFN